MTPVQKTLRRYGFVIRDSERPWAWWRYGGIFVATDDDGNFESFYIDGVCMENIDSNNKLK